MPEFEKLTLIIEIQQEAVEHTKKSDAVDMEKEEWLLKNPEGFGS